MGDSVNTESNSFPMHSIPPFDRRGNWPQFPVPTESRRVCSVRTNCRGTAIFMHSSPFQTWLRVKKGYPKWNPGKWNHGLKRAVLWWFSFDSYQNHSVFLSILHAFVSSSSSLFLNPRQPKSLSALSRPEKPWCLPRSCRRPNRLRCTHPERIQGLAAVELPGLGKNKACSC